MNTTEPRPEFPNPGRTENGKVFCNEPLQWETGMVIGHCERLVKTRPGRPNKPHRGPHRIEWWTA